MSRRGLAPPTASIPALAQEPDPGTVVAAGGTSWPIASATPNGRPPLLVDVYSVIRATDAKAARK
jgi:hypothetical protein